MRLPGPHDEVHGMHVTGMALPSSVHAAERRCPVCMYVCMYVCVFMYVYHTWMCVYICMWLE
jgi:hypothetical protein